MAVRIYPTFNDDDHIHITAGNPTTVDLFLGDDDQYVKIEKSQGNIVVGTNSNINQWTFGTDGNLTLPGGSRILDTVPTPGITRTKYTGSAAYDVNWYLTASVIETGIVTTISESYDDSLVGGADYSFQYAGYFRAPATGTYAFTMVADDSGRFWIGPNALAGYTAANANISIPMYAGGTTTTSLTADEFYPIRLQWNNASGPGSVAFTWSNDQGQANTSVLTGAVFADLGHTAITADNDIELRINNGTTSTWTFGGDGSVTFPDTTVQTTAYKRTTGSWDVHTGSDTYSFTVAQTGTYAMWVRGTCDNGIITWNATATVTNNNVPVTGQQFAWVYTGGGTPIDFTTIPAQFVGTANTIVRSDPTVTVPTNQFDFVINNTSGSAQTVYWGYVEQ